jgi:hypothetical protein
VTGHRTEGPGGNEPGVLYAVDRIEGRGPGARVILIGDGDRELDVPIGEFDPAAPPAEGAIYRMNPRSLDWRTAKRDRAEEKRRRQSAADTMKRLGTNDPGGDLKL